MRTIEISEVECAYLLKALAKQQYALERYTEMKGPEARVLQELALLKGIVEKLSHMDLGEPK